MMSEGEFVAVRPHQPDKRGDEKTDESSDTYDTIEWLLENLSNHNGRVGVWGGSASGFYATHTLIDSHPAVKAVSPQAPVTDWFLGDDRHHNGAYMLQACFSFLSSYGASRPEPTTDRARGFQDYDTPDGYQWYLDLGPLSSVNERYLHGQNTLWNEMMEHGTYDAYWQARTPLPHLKDVRPAVLVVGGFFDAQDLYGPLKTYDTIQNHNPDTASHLVMGPWRHGGWGYGPGDRYGNLYFGQATGSLFRSNILRPFFNYHLKDEGVWTLPDVMIFVTGSNIWHFFDAWPPLASKSKNLYLHPEGKLSFEAPIDTVGYAEYTSDPDKPVPHSPEIVIRRDDRYVIQDQRFVSSRPDVLVFQSEPLESNVTLTGDLFADLFVSTTGTDADFIVKLIDVYPGDQPCELPDGGCTVPMGGFQQMVRGEVMRAKFRTSFQFPEPLVSGEITEIKFDMQDVAHTFKRGHSVMVHIQSSWFPLVDRNPQQFLDIYSATDEEYRTAIHRVFFSKHYPSHLKMKVLE